LIETAARNGQVADLGWRVRKDGSRFSADVIITALHDSSGRLSGFAKITRDITERNQAASRLKEIEDLNRTLVGAATLGILAYEADGRCVLANEAAARIIGASLDAMRAQNFRELRSWREAGLFAAAEQALTTGEPQRLEVHFVTSFKHDVGLECALVRFASQGRPHLLLTFSDVTERQRLLAEVSRSNTDLEQFAYVASHDLKAPLRAIDSLALWLQEDLEPVLTPESRRYLALLRQRAGRMERLLDDLLTYARAGRTAAALVPVDCGKLVTEIIDLLNPPPGFVIRLPAPAPVFTTAVTPLRQVITNLIANAFKHHDQPKGVVQIGVLDLGDFYEFTVEDDGPGIPPEFHERIFGMFQTLRPRDEVEGSGIGLALVRRIVTRYGGSVAVECRQPRGSVFRFRWPKEIPPQ
jgi:PAS domain S-box-containing protein